MTGRPVYLLSLIGLLSVLCFFFLKKKNIYIKKKEGLFFREKKKGIGIGAK